MIDVGRLEQDLAATGDEALILPREIADGIVAELKRLQTENALLRQGETIAEVCARLRGDRIR